MPNSELDPNALLPAINISNPMRDKTSCSTARFDYLLKDGKLFFRARTADENRALVQGKLVPIEGDPLAWKLFDGVGIPYDENGLSLLAPGETIVDFRVASEIVVLISSSNRVYLYKPTEEKAPFYWENNIGAPDITSGILLMPEGCRGWDFSVSVKTKPEFRTTEFIDESEIVGYAQDRKGVNFDFGFTPTIYVLGKDGQKIFYWDTGLPPSFSRGFLVPDGMQGLFISAAGSTIFLCCVDSDNKLHFFTRMVDYELSGTCPGLTYTYDDTPAVHPFDDPNESYYLGKGVRAMPLPGWQEHPVDTILPNLSGQVCIRLTGKGNDARELRIQGKNPEEGWGYYFKNIAEDIPWGFRKASVNLLKSSTLTYDHNLDKTLKKSYTGHMYAHKLLHFHKVKTHLKFKLELKNFHPFLTDAEPCSLVITGPGGLSQLLPIHVVDAWGMDHHEYDHRLIGTVDGTPKPLMATLVLTPEQKQWIKQDQSPLAAYIRHHYLPYDRETKAMQIIADDGMVNLEFGNKELRFQRTLTEKEISHSFYMQLASDPQLCIPLEPEELAVYLLDDLEKCTVILAKNKDCLEKIEKMFSSHRLEEIDHLFINTVINASMDMIHPTTSLLFKVLPDDVSYKEDPTYKNAIADAETLFEVRGRAMRYLAKVGKTRAVGYLNAVGILNERIDILTDRIEKLTAPIEDQQEMNQHKVFSCCF